MKAGDFKPCALCGKGMMHSGVPLFYRVLAVNRGWGRQRIAARQGNLRTQVGGNVGGLPLSVAGMRPSKTGTICGAVDSRGAMKR